VNQAATEIGYQYLAEIAPYVSGLDLERFLHRLPGHVLTQDEVETLFREHNAATGGLDEKHVFCALYRVGLLGDVHHDRVRGEWVQRFLRPGEGPLEADGVLPRASHYLVHPALSDVIGRTNPPYLERLERVDVVGYGRPWREPATVNSTVSVHRLCVLKGDIRGFGGLMRAGSDAPVRKALEEAVQRWAQETALAEVRAGDAVLIVHEDAGTLAQIARHLMDDVYKAPGQPRLRIALHFGEVAIRRRAGEASPIVGGGEAVLCATRVEPLVEPGQIWVTEEFREELARTPSLWRTTPMVAPDGEERFNVKKEGREEADLWVRLFRLEF